jgi:hypothetical protein
VKLITFLTAVDGGQRLNMSSTYSQGYTRLYLLNVLLYGPRVSGCVGKEK